MTRYIERTLWTLLIINGVVALGGFILGDYWAAAYGTMGATVALLCLFAWEHVQSRSCCVRCGAQPIRETLDGDALCQSCCDAWARAERPDPWSVG